MAHVKTAISLREALFEEAEFLARKMKISRSRLFALALEEFIRHHQNQQLLEKLNAAYNDVLDPAEESLRRQMRRQHKRLVEGESYQHGDRLCANVKSQTCPSPRQSLA